MIGLAIALIVALGLGGTAVVADTARPGDALFTVDQAVEDIRLSLTSDQKKDDLKITFAQERVEEIESLKAEDTTEKDTQPEVAVGIESALSLLASLKNDTGVDTRIDELTKKLNEEVALFPANTRIEAIDDDFHLNFEEEDTQESDDTESEKEESKIEIQSEKGHIKIEMKNGSLEIETKDQSKSNDEKKTISKNSFGIVQKAEAKLFAGKTLVEVKSTIGEITFVTSETERGALVAAIVAKVPGSTAAQIESVLKIEAEESKDDGQDDENDQEDEEENEQEDDRGDDTKKEETE